MADGRIAAVGDAGTSDGAIDCSRFAVVPGMVNAHAHSNENWFRGLWDNLPLEPWMLFSYPVLAAPAQSAEEIYVRTLLGGIEMLRSGATCVVDFLYDNEAALEPVVRAYRDLGLRALVALAMSDRAYHETVVLDEGLVSRDLVDRMEREKPPSWDEWSAVARRAVERFHRPDEGISICLAPSGPQRCTDELLVGSAALADELDLMIHIHVLETRMQAVSGQQLYGRTLPEHLDDIGFLSPRVCFEHGIWLAPSDLELVRDRGVTIVHNPVSNMKLGSGIAPVPELLAPWRERRARHRRDVLERRQRHVRGAEGRLAAPQALGDRLRELARRRRGVADGDRRRRNRRRRSRRPGLRSSRAGAPTSCFSTSTRSSSRR